MRRRTIIIPLLLIFAMAIGLSLRNYHPGPEYQNHPLSYWLNYNPLEENEAYNQLRFKALETIGTNALPVYVAWLHAKDPYLKQKLMELLAMVHIHVCSAAEYHDKAEFGWHFGNLSDEMVNPIIWEEFSQHETRGCGLVYLGQEQHCIYTLHHGTVKERERAACEMPNYFPVPELIKALTLVLQDTSPRMRYFAARSLGKTSATSQPAIPALIRSLQDENEFVRMTAAFALGKFGRGAASAKTALLPLLKDPNADVRACAKLALQQIDTEETIIQAKK